MLKGADSDDVGFLKTNHRFDKKSYSFKSYQTLAPLGDAGFCGTDPYCDFLKDEELENRVKGVLINQIR
jgi:hypothetical protein